MAKKVPVIFPTTPEEERRIAKGLEIGEVARGELGLLSGFDTERVSEAIGPDYNPRTGHPIKWETVLRVGSEGGAIALYGTRTDRGWIFSRTVRDHSAVMLGESDITHRSDPCSTWEEAVALIDAYPWTRLSPIEIHPEFQGLVWQEIMRRHLQSPLRDDRLSDWRELCLSPSSGD